VKQETKESARKNFLRFTERSNSLDTIAELVNSILTVLGYDDLQTASHLQILYGHMKVCLQMLSKNCEKQLLTHSSLPVRMEGLGPQWTAFHET
jgi:hypothetical protein